MLGERQKLPPLAALEAACEPGASRVGAAVLGQRCDRRPTFAVIAEAAGIVVGAVLSLRFARLGELLGISAPQVHELHRDDGELLMISSVWLTETAADQREEIEAAMLRYVMLRALHAGDVKTVVLATPCCAELAALELGAGLLRLRHEPHVVRQIRRGAMLLQQILPAWWPAHGAAPAGERKGSSVTHAHAATRSLESLALHPRPRRLARHRLTMHACLCLCCLCVRSIP